LAKAGKPLEAVVVMTAETDVIIRRITGRRSCPVCGRIYHMANMSPRKENICDDCGTALVQRDDDTEAVVRQRMEAYNRQTEPVIEYYRGCKELKMIEVDGGKEADVVFKSLTRSLEGLGASC
jgi:adenylate kinase